MQATLIFDRKLPLVVFMVLGHCLAGCGGSTSEARVSPPTAQTTDTTAGSLQDVAPEPQPPMTAGEQSPSSPVKTAESSPSSLATTADSKTTAAAPSKAADNAAPQVVTQQTAAAQIAAAPVPPRVQPSPEQLNRWQQPNYKRLELLAIHDPQSPMGIGEIAAIDATRYLIAGTQLAIRNVQNHAPEQVLMERADENKVITTLAMSPTGTWCAAGSKDGTLAIIDLNSGQVLRSKQLYPSSVVQVAISTSGKELATISFDDEVSVLSADTLDKTKTWTLDTHGVKRLQYIAPTVLIAAGETMSSWDTTTGRALTKYPASRFHSVTTRSNDGKQLIFLTAQGLQVWDLTTDKALHQVAGDFATNEAISLSDDGRWLATANANTVRIWERSSGRLCQIIDNSGYTPVGLQWLGDSGLLVIASEMGRCRVWGTPEAGQRAQLKPLHAPMKLDDVDLTSPANSAQLLATIDLRLFPEYPGSTDGFTGVSTSNYNVKATSEEIKTFYRYLLQQSGWTESSSPSTPHALDFQRNGFTLSLAVYEAGPDQSSVNLSLMGRTNLQQLPKLEEFKPAIMYEGPSTVMVKAKGTLSELEASLLRGMHRANWTLVTSLGEQDDDPSGRQLRFLKNAEVVSYNLRADQAEPGTFIVQSGREHTLYSLPLPDDCGVAEWDDHLGPKLVTTTKMTLPQAVAFFDEAMQKAGFLAQTWGRSIKEDRCYVAYVREEQDVQIGLEAIAGGSTRVMIGNDLGESWHLQKPEQDDAPAKEAGEASEVAYTRWLQQHGHPATMALLDQWALEMKAIAATAKAP